MKKSFFEDLPARKKPAHVPADGTPDGVDSNEGGVDAKKVRQAVYDIRYRAKREDVELEQAMSQYFGNTTMTGPEKDAVKAKLFGEGYGLVSQQIWSDTMELEERAKGTGRDRKYRVRVKDKVSGRTYGRWANREKISQLRSNPSIGAQGVEMSDAGKAYEGDDDDAGKTTPKAKKDDKKPTKKEDPKMKKEEAKVKRWWDDDGDGKGYEPGEVDGKFPDKDGSKKKKKKHTKKEESKFFNWREVFFEEMGDKIDKVTEKKVNNKIKINPQQGQQ